MGKKRRSRTFQEDNQIIDIEEERQKRREKRKQLAEKKKKKPESAGPASGRRTAKKIKRRLFYGAIFLFIAGMIGYSVYNVVTLRIERTQAQEEKQELEKEKQRLDKELSLVDSDEYIEEKARSELHMIKAGENIYVLPKDETSGGIQAAQGLEATGGAVETTEDAGAPQEEEKEGTISGIWTGIKDVIQSVIENLKTLVRK